MPVKRYNGSDWEVISGVGLQGPAGNDGTAPLTTKGQLLTRTASAVSALAVGSNDQVLTADSSTATGLKWATPAAGGMTLLSTTTLTGSSVSISSISSSYIDLYITIENFWVSAAGYPYYRLNSDSTNGNYNELGIRANWTGAVDAIRRNTGTEFYFNGNADCDTYDQKNFGFIYIPLYTSTNAKKIIEHAFYNINSAGNKTIQYGYNVWSATAAAVNSITIYSGSGNFNGGTVKVYGVK